MDLFRFGIIGCGGIAHKFARAIPLVQGVCISSCAARDLSRAQAFASELYIPAAFGSYEELLTKDKPDAVYISTQHPYHADAVKLALEAGIAVLCEKPLTVNAAQARVLQTTASRCNTFLMEAMWTRFLPLYDSLRECVAQGKIGKIVRIEADFSRYNAFNPASRLYNMESGAGVLIDMTIYSLTFAAMFLGETPETVVSDLVCSPTGSDMQNALILRYPDGVQAVLTGAITATTPILGRIIGTEGILEVPDFMKAFRATLHRGDEPPVLLEDGFGSANGFEYEIQEVIRCVRAGKTESDKLPIATTIAMLDLMDSIRAQHGLRYPCETDLAPGTDQAH